MRRTALLIVGFIGMAALSFIGGYFCSRLTTEPETIIQTKYVDRIIEVPQRVYSVEFRQFASQDILSKWLAQNHIEEREGWMCIDYALEMQQRALLAGHQMSTEYLIDKGGKTGHAICSTIIGNEIIFLEPQTGISWIGGIKDTIIQYAPIKTIYDPSGNIIEEIYREE